MNKFLNTPVCKGLTCGVLTAAVQFWFIPRFLIRGVPDFIWIALMIILPAIAAFLLLRQCKSHTVLWSLLAQCIILIIFFRPIGQFHGYRLENFGRDLFDYIAFGMYGFGWTLGAAAVQWLTIADSGKKA